MIVARHTSALELTITYNQDVSSTTPNEFDFLLGPGGGPPDTITPISPTEIILGFGVAPTGGNTITYIGSEPGFATPQMLLIT